MGYFDSIYAAGLPHRAVTVYAYLKGCANTQGVCWPPARTIARDLNLSRATVQRAIQDLQKGGWITTEERWRENGSNSSNLYKVL